MQYNKRERKEVILLACPFLLFLLEIKIGKLKVLVTVLRI